MTVCSMEEWLDMQLMHHQNQVTRYLKMIVDYKNGDYWYKVETMTAYADKGCNILTEVGHKGEHQEKVIERCQQRFRLAFKDYRPHAMITVRYMCFESGHLMKLEDRDPNYEY